VAGEDDYNGQKDLVDELTSIARDTDMHIHIVHHLRKVPDITQVPTKYDFKGSGAITDLVDNCICVWRNKPKERKVQESRNVDGKEPDEILNVDKQRNGEWEGWINLWYHPGSQQYLEKKGDEPIKLYLPPEEKS
jgi:twinkle protein